MSNVTDKAVTSWRLLEERSAMLVGTRSMMGRSRSHKGDGRAKAETERDQERGPGSASAASAVL